MTFRYVGEDGDGELGDLFADPSVAGRDIQSLFCCGFSPPAVEAAVARLEEVGCGRLGNLPCTRADGMSGVRVWAGAVKFELAELNSANLSRERLRQL